MDKFKALIGRSPNFESVVRSAQMVAATDVTVLISGETGTGKEVLATAIQRSSRRADRPFITLNCAALPDGIAESELFGHRKGAFTGATSNQIGRLQAADGGTLFLDEIDSLPLALQSKLLRFLESGECQPVGDTQTEIVDVRVIAATNSDLGAKIDAGEFRQDLFFRLNVVPLELPPLRERKADIESLGRNFTKRYASEHRLRESQFTKSAINKMRDYAWPGNIRELRNVCERLTILLQGQEIGAQNLPAEILFTAPVTQKSGVSLPENGIDLETLEIDLICQALERTKGNRSKSARLLGISRDTLLYRIQKYQIAS